MNTQNGYMAFFDRKRAEIYADTYFEAKEKAVKHFKTPKSKQHLVVVVLVEKAGEMVEQSTVM